MTLLLSDLRRAVEDLLAAESGRAGSPAGGGDFADGLWSVLDENGFLAAHLAEASGGAGLGASGAEVVLRALGRHAAPVPAVEAFAATSLAAAAGLPLPNGLVTVANDLGRDTVRIPWARYASAAIVETSERDGRFLRLVTIDPGAVQRGSNIAGEPRDRVPCESLAEVARADLDDAAPGVEALGAFGRAAQMAGALETLLDLAVLYAGERRQFGRPIAKFQAIQQEIARLAGHVAAAGMASVVAARAIDTGEDAGFEIAVAKARAGEAAEVAPSIAHQVHGAIGFTDEHSLHHFTRRLWAWRHEFGGTRRWRAALGGAVRGRPRGTIWRELTARPVFTRGNPE